MAFQVPNSKNYSSPLNAVPLDWTSLPVEGAKGIQCSIAWGSQGGPNNSVYVNCQNNATLNFSKIRAMVVDNSKSGSDVIFTFPDTETTLTIPAYAPYGIYPVFTNQTQFYITSPNAESEDITAFMILNTSPPPIAVPITEEQNFFTDGAITTGGASGSFALIGSGVSGTMEGLIISAQGQAQDNNVSDTVYSIQDGQGHTLWTGVVQVPGDLYANVLLASVSGLHLRFQSGLNLFWTTTASTIPKLTVAVNVYYRTP